MNPDRLPAQEPESSRPRDRTSPTTVALAVVMGAVLVGAILATRALNLAERAHVTAAGGPATAAAQGIEIVRVAVWAIAAASLVAMALAIRSERRERNRVGARTAELQQVSDSLLRANRAKNEFLANVSHELRTPLNAIVGFTELLRDGVYGELSPRQALPVQRIEASANQLRDLVERILDLARISSGRLEVHREPIDLRPFLIELATEVEPLAKERGLALSLTLGATLPRVHTDPTHLRHIVLNLLGNAVKFTPAGTVTIRTRANGAPGAADPTLGKPPRPGAAWIAVQVADTGIGIAPRDRERIFAEFERAPTDSRAGTPQRGTGLGLAISRRLAVLLGGEITLESELGAGSCFTLWLPLEERSASA